MAFTGYSKSITTNNNNNYRVIIDLTRDHNRLNNTTNANINTQNNHQTQILEETALLQQDYNRDKSQSPSVPPLPPPPTSASITCITFKQNPDTISANNQKQDISLPPIPPLPPSPSSCTAYRKYRVGQKVYVCDMYGPDKEQLKAEIREILSDDMYKILGPLQSEPHWQNMRPIHARRLSLIPEQVKPEQTHEQKNNHKKSKSKQSPTTFTDLLRSRLNSSRQSIEFLTKQVIELNMKKEDESVKHYVDAIVNHYYSLPASDTLAVLYLIDFIAKVHGQLFVEKFNEYIHQMMDRAYQSMNKDNKNKVIQLLNFWIKHCIFPQDTLNKILLSFGLKKCKRNNGIRKKRKKRKKRKNRDKQRNSSQNTNNYNNNRNDTNSASTTLRNFNQSNQAPSNTKHVPSIADITDINIGALLLLKKQIDEVMKPRNIPHGMMAELASKIGRFSNSTNNSNQSSKKKDRGDNGHPLWNNNATDTRKASHIGSNGIVGITNGMSINRKKRKRNDGIPSNEDVNVIQPKKKRKQGNSRQNRNKYNHNRNNTNSNNSNSVSTTLPYLNYANQAPSNIRHAPSKYMTVYKTTHLGLKVPIGIKKSKYNIDDNDVGRFKDTVLWKYYEKRRKQMNNGSDDDRSSLISSDEDEDYDIHINKLIVGDKERTRNVDKDAGPSNNEIEIMENSKSTKCPLTLSKMVEPMKNPICGHTFEKSAIIGYVKAQRQENNNKKVECPMMACKQEIYINNLVVDREILGLIKKGKKKTNTKEDKKTIESIDIMSDDEDEDEEENDSKHHMEQGLIGNNDNNSNTSPASPITPIQPPVRPPRVIPVASYDMYESDSDIEILN